MNLRSGKHVDSVLEREVAKRRVNRAGVTAADNSCEEHQLLLKVVVAMAVIFIGLVLYAEWNNLWFGRTHAQDVPTTALVPPIQPDKAPTGDSPAPFHVTLPSQGSTAVDYARVIEAMLEHHPPSVRPFVEAMGTGLLKEVVKKLVEKDNRLLELFSDAMKLPPDPEEQCSFNVNSDTGEMEVVCDGDLSVDTANHQEL